MSTPPTPNAWPPQPSPLSSRINDRLWFTDHDGSRVVYGPWGQVLYVAALEDEIELRAICVWLRRAKLASQADLAAAFGHTERTQRRWEKAYDREGLDGLRRRKAPGAVLKIRGSSEALVRSWHVEGVAVKEMARRLGVAETTVRQTLRRLGLLAGPQDSAKAEGSIGSSTLLFDEGDADEEGTDEGAIDDDDGGGDDGSGGTQGNGQGRHDGGESDSSEAVDGSEGSDSAGTTTCGAGVVPGSQDREDAVSTWVGNPLDRTTDRMLARMGLLHDADPIFAASEALPRAGVLLAIPLLAKSGALDVFERIYGSIGPAFFGLRTTAVCLFLLALLRIRRPENLKEFSPPALGRLLGLDRAPEVKTLRRKLARLAGRERGKELIAELAKARVAIVDDPSVVGVLYMDGHVIQYHGKHELSRTHITTRNLAGPATTDTWVNDSRGDPLFVVPCELNEGLTQTLEPAMAMARSLIAPGRRITVVFDRGGWSPELFERLIDSGCDIITYRKGKRRKRAESKFEARTIQVDGLKIEYQLYDAPRRKIGRRKVSKKQIAEGEPKYLWLREVTRLREDGKQTAVITSRTDLSAEKVLYLMFNRWRQENFFKYMMEEFAMDTLVEYGAEPVEAGRDRPNPARKPIEKKISAAETRLASIDRRLGVEAAANEEARRRTMRGFKIAHADLLREREETLTEIDTLRAAVSRIPKRVSADDLKRLHQERKLVSQAIKTLAYQVESDLCRLIAPHYQRAKDEGRTLLHAAFQSAARIDVTNEELRVTIEPQSSPHRSQALAQLCAQIDAIGATFPGTNLRLRVAAEVQKPVMV